MSKEKLLKNPSLSFLGINARNIALAIENSWKEQSYISVFLNSDNDDMNILKVSHYTQDQLDKLNEKYRDRFFVIHAKAFSSIVDYAEHMHKCLSPIYGNILAEMDIDFVQEEMGIERV